MNQQVMNLAALAAGAGVPDIRGISWSVASESGGATLAYTVAAHRTDAGFAFSCDCPDQAQRTKRDASHLCKHIRMVAHAALAAGVAAAAATAIASSAINDIVDELQGKRDQVFEVTVPETMPTLAELVRAGAAKRAAREQSEAGNVEGSTRCGCGRTKKPQFRNCYACGEAAMAKVNELYA